MDAPRSATYRHSRDAAPAHPLSGEHTPHKLTSLQVEGSSYITNAKVLRSANKYFAAIQATTTYKEAIKDKDPSCIELLLDSDAPGFTIKDDPDREVYTFFNIANSSSSATDRTTILTNSAAIQKLALEFKEPTRRHHRRAARAPMTPMPTSPPGSERADRRGATPPLVPAHDLHADCAARVDSLSLTLQRSVEDRDRLILETRSLTDHLLAARGEISKNETDISVLTSRLRDSEQTLAEAESSIALLSHELHSTRNELRGLIPGYRDLEAALQNARRVIDSQGIALEAVRAELRVKDSELSGLGRERDSTLLDLDCARSDCTRLTARAEGLRGSLTDTTEHRDRIQGLLTAAEQELATATDRLTALQERIRTQDAAILDLESRIADLTATNRALTETNAAANAAIGGYLQTIDRLTAKGGLDTARIQELTSQLQEEIETNIGRVGELSHQVSTLEEQLASSAALTRSLQGQVDTHTQEVTRLTGLLRTARDTDIPALQAQLRDANERLSESQSDLQAQTTANGALRAEVQSLSARNTSFQLEIHALQARIDSQSGVAAALAGQFEALESTLRIPAPDEGSPPRTPEERLTLIIAASGTHLRDLESQLASRQDALAALQQEFAAQTQTVDRLSRELAEATPARREIPGLRSELSAAQERLAETVRALEEQTRANGELRSEIGALRGRNSELDAEIQSLQSSIEAQAGVTAALEGQLDAVEGTLQIPALDDGSPRQTPQGRLALILQTYRERFVGFEQDLGTLRQTVDSLREQLAAATEVGAAVPGLSERLAGAEEELQAQINANATLSRGLSGSLELSSVFQEEIASKSATIGRLQAEISASGGITSELREDLGIAQRALAQALDASADARARNSDLDSALGALRGQFEAENASLVGELSAARRAAAALAETNKDAAGIQARRIQTLENQLADSRHLGAELDRIGKELQAATNTITALRAREAHTGVAGSALEAALSAEKEANKELQRLLDAYKGRAETAEGQVQKILSELGLIPISGTPQPQVSAIVLSINGMKDRAERAEAGLAATRRELAQKDKELSELFNRVAEGLKHVFTGSLRETEISFLITQLVAIGEHDLAETLTSYQRTMTELRSKIQEGEGQIAKLKSQIGELTELNSLLQRSQGIAYSHVAAAFDELTGKTTPRKLTTSTLTALPQIIDKLRDASIIHRDNAKRLEAELNKATIAFERKSGKLESQLVSMTQLRDAAEQSLAETQARNKAAEEMVAAQKRQLTKLTASLSESEEIRGSNSDDFNRERSKLAKALGMSKESNLRDLHQAITAQSRVNKDRRVQIEAQAETIASQESDILSLRTELEDLSAELAGLREERNTAGELGLELDAKNTQLEQANSQLLAELKAQLAIVSVLTGDKTQLEDRLGAMSSELQSRTLQFKDTIGALETNLRMKIDRITTLELELQISTLEAKQLKTENSRLESQLAASEASLRRAQATIHDLEGRLATEVEKSQSLQRALVSAKTDIEALKERARSEKEEFSTLKEELKELKLAYEAAKLKSKAAREELEALRPAHDAAQTESRRANSELAQLKSSLLLAHSTAVSKERDFKATKEELSRKEQIIQELHLELEAAKATIDALSAQNSSLLGRVTHLQKELVDRDQLIAELSGQNLELRREAPRLRDALSLRDLVIEDLTSHIRRADELETRRREQELDIDACEEEPTIETDDSDSLMRRMDEVSDILDLIKELQGTGAKKAKQRLEFEDEAHYEYFLFQQLLITGEIKPIHQSLTTHFFMSKSAVLKLFNGSSDAARQEIRTLWGVERLSEKDKDKLASKNIGNFEYKILYSHDSAKKYSLQDRSNATLQARFHHNYLGKIHSHIRRNRGNEASLTESLGSFKTHCREIKAKLQDYHKRKAPEIAKLQAAEDELSVALSRTRRGDNVAIERIHVELEAIGEKLQRLRQPAQILANSLVEKGTPLCRDLVKHRACLPGNSDLISLNLLFSSNFKGVTPTIRRPTGAGAGSSSRK